MTVALPEQEELALPFDPESPLAPSGNLRRRQLVNQAAEAAFRGAALLALAVLGIVVYSVVKRGASIISWKFLTTPAPRFGGVGGGIAHAIIGTAVIVALATAIAMPIGVLVALYLTEFARGRLGRWLRLALDLMNGLPSIVVAVFVFGLMVAGHQQSGFAGSVALAIIMLPLIARASQEVILLVPNSQREAAAALGVSHWRTVTGVILPSAIGGIVTGTVLAVARAAGETAPLLLLTSNAPNSVAVNPFGHPLPNIPVYIFTASEQADPSGFARAWGAALMLLSVILIANILARALLARSRAKLTQ